jgi:hypothetical protein
MTPNQEDLYLGLLSLRESARDMGVGLMRLQRVCKRLELGQEAWGILLLDGDDRKVARAELARIKRGWPKKPRPA